MSSGVKKAAMLLRALDSATAAELLRAAAPEVITEIAAELAYLDAAGAETAKRSVEPVREFYGLLHKKGGALGRGDFLRSTLNSALGEQKSQELLGRVQDMIYARDPFLPIRSAAVEDISRALEGESAQVVALVLSELPPSRSAALLALLEEEVRAEAVRGMTAGQEVSPQARLRVGTVVRNRLQSAKPEAAAGPVSQANREQQLRKVAVLLRGLSTDLRDALVKAIEEQDAETASTVQNLMVTWEDLPTVADRPLQEALRSVDSRVLALALVNAPEEITSKIRANISERAAAMLDEEASLLSSPKPEEIQESRNEVLVALRDMNSRGDLQFEQAGSA